MDTFNNDFSIDDGLKTENTDDGQEMSGMKDTGSKMLDDLQNPMSVAPPSVASSMHGDYDQPDSPMSHFSHPPSPGNDSPPPSPLQHPPRPDTASSINQPPTPIAFGEIQQPMTPMSQRSMTPQPRPEQPPTPITQYPEPQSPMPIHMPIQAPMSTNQVMNSMHQSVQNPSMQSTQPQQPPNTQRMNLRERKETPMNHYQAMDQSDQISNNRRRRVRRQLIIDQVRTITFIRMLSFEFYPCNGGCSYDFYLDSLY